MKNRFSQMFTLVSALLLAGCSEHPVGSKDRPFSMYFIPATESQSIADGADKLARFVATEVSRSLYGKDSGFYVKAAVPSSYIAIVEAFGTNKADFAAFTTFSYVLTRDIKKYPIGVVLSVVRGEGESTYKGQIIVRSDSGINKLEDLNRKKFAFVDPSSTTGYVLPSEIFSQKGITLGETVFAQKHDNVVAMVYQKQVDGGATYYSPPLNGKIRDAREKLKTQFPDVEDKVKIIGFTQDVPNDPWVIRTNLFKDEKETSRVRDAVVAALLQYAGTTEGKQVLDQLYSLSGLRKVDDSTYEPIRKILLSSKIDIENEVNKKKK